MALLVFFLLLLMLVYGWLFTWCHRWWKKLPEAEETKLFTPATTVSLIVPVRNEAGRLQGLINTLLNQQYPASLLEIIFIDDHSEDHTVALLNELTAQNKSIRVLKLEPSAEGKKAAVELGVLNATGRLIVATDADITAGPEWLLTVVSFYQSTHAKFIASPVRMKGKGVSGVFQTLDFMTMQGITGAAVGSRLLSMCNGANIAYEKKVFLEVGGFEGIDAIPSGDDMLLMEKIYRRYPEDVLYLKDERAMVTTPAETGWTGFLQQRIRWASKSVHYRDKKIFFVLLLTYLLNAGLLTMLIIVIFHQQWFWIWVILMLIKLLLEFPLVWSVSGFFNQRRLLGWYPLFQPLHLIYVVIAGFLGRFGSYRWKSRHIINTGKSKSS